MKRTAILTILILLLSTVTATAQDLYVKSFQALPMDMTASSLTGKKIDRNGEVAALIKIVTPEKGFIFDGGTLGIVGTKEETGEIWVWVPRAARKITIGHPQLGMIKNYEYPISIEAERTYEMILTTEKQETTTGSLGVDGSPDGATVYLNGEVKGVTPKLITGLAEGGYEVRVVKEGYTEHSETVSVKIGQRAQVTVRLKTSVPVGAISGVFSVSETKQVYFSKGNLQYQASTKTWRFAEHQWDFVGGQIGPISSVTHKEELVGNVRGSSNDDASETYDRWIDLFGWATSGFNHGAVNYQPWSTDWPCGNYSPYGKDMTNLQDENGTADWGYNAISNGGNEIGQWYTLTKEEWEYMLFSRPGSRFAKARVNSVEGVILLPDNWNNAKFALSNVNDIDGFNNIVSENDWATLETAGAVFLPYAYTRRGEPISSYWSSAYGTTRHPDAPNPTAMALVVYPTGLEMMELCTSLGCSVRLVHDADQPWKKASVYSKITFAVDADAEIWLEGEKKGVRSWRGFLPDGTYRFECRFPNYEPVINTIVVDESKAGQTITLTMPNGSLNVASTPDHAKVFIDGKEMGETPLEIPEIRIGQYELRIANDGYVDHVEAVSIHKGVLKQVAAKLNRGHAVQFTCNVWDAQLEIDGKNVGPANGNYQLTNGNHKLKASTGFYKDYIFNMKVNESGPQSHDISMECAEKEKTFTVNGVNFVMKMVEGGTFKMGSGEEGQGPVHDVSLSAYYMGEIEVTQGLWKAVMDSEPTKEGKAIWTDELGKGDNYPVYGVDWNDSQEFILKLNQKTGKNFRLPSEAEWEYAARGGNLSHGYKYAGSDNMEDVCWCKGKDNLIFHEGKTKLPNELGLYDMTGSVAEWCLDYFLFNYTSEAQTNPIVETPPYGESSSHVKRGGQLLMSDYYTVYCRNYLDDNVGFRLCLSK